jgi:hypothetical protein
VLVYNSYIYPTMEKMRKLRWRPTEGSLYSPRRHVVLHGVCDNQTLSIMGQHCAVLNYLDITGAAAAQPSDPFPPGSADVTDVGIQNLVFPLSIQKAGRVNLVNTRARCAGGQKEGGVERWKGE